MTKDQTHASLVALAALALAFPVVAVAAPVDIPHQFAAGEAIVADEFNENFDAIADAINDNDSRLEAVEMDIGLPAGAVMFFNLDACPEGWSGMTDLEGRVPIGVPSGGTLASTVGTALDDEGTRTITNVPAHTHSVDPPSTSTDASPNHSHSVDPPSETIAASGLHSHSVSTSGAGDGEHNHTITGGSHDHSIRTEVLGNYDTFAVAGIVNSNSWENTSVPIQGGGSHTHTVTNSGGHSHSVSINSSGSHSHTFNMAGFNSGNGGSHSHTVDIGSFTSGSAGSSSVDVTMPYVQLLACEKD